LRDEEKSMAENNLSINQREATILLELLQLQKALTRDQKQIAEKIQRYLGRKPLSGV
jgi:hypothetical protein